MSFFLALALTFVSSLQGETPKSARQIVEAAIDHWRGETSYTLAEMLVHRKGWHSFLVPGYFRYKRILRLSQAPRWNIGDLQEYFQTYLHVMR